MRDIVPKNRVIKIDSDVFTVDTGGTLVKCRARKTVKAGRADVRVGDFVTLDCSAEPVISGVLPRNNALIRPAVANVDAVIIVIAPEPLPDFLTVDKLIVNCRAAGIRPIVCLNKNDLAYDFSAVVAAYRDFADAVVSVSAARGDIGALTELLRGRLCALAGQSAVGKSSLVNTIAGVDRAVGGVSEKIGRGKNTTTRAEIIPLGDGSYVVDTPGFSMLDVHATPADELADGYGYTEYARACRFGGRCTHTVEPDCAVRAAAERGETSGDRYFRYVKLYETIKRSERY